MDLLQNTKIRTLVVSDLCEFKMFHVKHFMNYKISDLSFFAYLTRPQYQTFGMFHVKHLIGYVIFQVSSFEADIVYIGVHPNYRRQGVATRLLNCKCFTCNIPENGIGQFKIFLEVETENFSALSFYKAQGFEIVSVRKKYLKGKDAYLMCKTI